MKRWTFIFFVLVCAMACGAQQVFTLRDLAYSASAGAVTSSEIPMQVPGLVSWKSAASITGVANGGIVETWADLKNTAFNWTQVTESKKPTYYTNQQGGKPLVFFDAVDDAMASSTQTINRVRTIFLVGKTVSGKDAYFINQTPNDSIVYTSSRNLYLYSGANGNVQSTSQIPTNTCVAMEAVFSGTLTAAYTNGVLCSGSVNSGYTGTTTGAVFCGSATYTGFLAEYLIYEGVVSTNNRTLIRDYLRTKWSLP